MELVGGMCEEEKSRFWSVFGEFKEELESAADTDTEIRVKLGEALVVWDQINENKRGKSAVSSDEDGKGMSCSLRGR